MPSITIENIDEDLRRRLQRRAGRHGHSVEAEALGILRSAVARDEGETAPGNLAEAIRAIVEPLGGIELDIPPRAPAREPPDFA
ncbi:MAG: plasmid stabilization protein [Rhodomicrobium sp.]